MDKQKVIDIILDEKYCDEKDLRYKTDAGYLFTRSQFEQFKEIKNSLVDEGYKHIIKLPLKTFDSEHIFFVYGLYLGETLRDYLSATLEDVRENNAFLTERRSDEIDAARIFSEIEGTLNIENVKTTHKRIKEVCEKGDLKEENDIIIRNMNMAIDFIKDDKPEFNKENLYKLYNILSKDCLDEEDLLNGGYYRDGKVTIGNGIADRDSGAPHEKIEEMMDSLFQFVAEYKDNEQFDYFLPHICHYYMIYVHPYFDYNGRTARMVSFWISRMIASYRLPLFISEAINENKSQYYKAIRDTREMNNDLTYFLGYIFETATKFSFVYKNVEETEKKLAASGDFLTNTEHLYLKKIFIHSAGSYFIVKQFIQYVNNNITKQAAFKVLNRLAEYGVLDVSENKSKEKIYKLNEKFITYKYTK